MDSDNNTSSPWSVPTYDLRITEIEMVRSWRSMYSEWEEGTAYSPSPYDLACVAFDLYPVPCEDLDELADRISDMLDDGKYLICIAKAILPQEGQYVWKSCGTTWSQSPLILPSDPAFIPPSPIL